MTGGWLGWRGGPVTKWSCKGPLKSHYILTFVLSLSLDTWETSHCSVNVLFCRDLSNVHLLFNYREISQMDVYDIFVESMSINRLNGFPPIWLSLCVVKWSDGLNNFTQNIHSKGFPPIWLSLCVGKWSRLLKYLFTEHTLERILSIMTKLMFW